MQEIRIKGSKEKPAFKQVLIEGIKISEDNGILSIAGYANTKGHPDRYGDVPSVFPAKRNYVYELANYRKNPVLLLDHNHNSDHLAGQMADIREDDIGLFFKAHLIDSPLPAMLHARAAIKAGALRGVSIAGTFYYENSDMPNQLTLADIYEISLVTVPADPDALAGPVSKNANSQSKTREIIEELKRLDITLRTADEIKKLAREIAARK